MILYHKTKFGRAEQPRQSALRAGAARDRLARWLAAPGAPAGLVLTRPASVAWATGGVAPPVDRGADAPVLIVGGDDRVRRYRHPMAVGAPARHLVMAVVVARRGGLHAAATRFPCAGRLHPELRALPGGAKAEDTYLVHPGGLERVTTGPAWPVEDGDGVVPPRPAVLEVGR